MTFERFFEMPRAMTFLMPKTKAWVEARLEGLTLNLFGGLIRLPNSIHNDLNKELLVDGDLSYDACDLLSWRDYAGHFDTIVVDPPYSFFQSVVSYGMKRKQKVSHARDVVEYVLKPTGRVISLGWNSTGMSAGRGFRKEELLLVNHGGSHNDTLILLEQRTGDDVI